MNIEKVNNALLRGINVMQMSENQSLAESYTGSGGSFGTPDATPDGDPMRGGAGGVDNNASDAEAFDSYIEQAAMGVSARCGVGLDDALDWVVSAADDMAERGLIPAMPDPESATSEELSAWAGAAKTAQLGAEAIRMAMEDAGDLGQAVGGGQP